MSQPSCADFLAGFVKPFVAGGELHVGKPISVVDVERFADQLPHASVPMMEVEEARTEVLSELVVRAPSLVLDSDELALAASVHNLLYLVHPDADGLLVTQGALKKVLDTAQQFAAQPLSKNRRRVLARHGLLHNLFDVTRADITVSWWTGQATFQGQKPPRRLTAWQSVRRVREETEIARYHDLLVTPEANRVVATLMRRSPLTHLLSSRKGAPPLHWEDAVFLLRDTELARAIAYRAVDGDGAEQVMDTPARLAAAFERMLDRSPVTADLRAVAAFLVHLNVLLAMAELREVDLQTRSPLLTTVLAAERAGQRPRGLASFLALPNALAAVDIRLAEPPGLRDDTPLKLRWEQHRQQVAEGVGEAVIETLAGRIRRHLSGGAVSTGSTSVAEPG